MKNFDAFKDRGDVIWNIANILDFRNTPEEIFAAFKPYYEDTPVEPMTDAQHLYRLQHQIE
jgi:hypothetical protein